MREHRLTDSSLTASLSRLYCLEAFGVKFGLETERALLDRLGHPERGLKIIHIAGTNGKGSVSAMIDAVLRAAGLKTGLYTSPHLIRFNERIRVNGRCIPDPELSHLIQLVEEHAQAIAHRPGGQDVTFFEFATAMAFEYFRQQQVDVVVLETGMGGRLDATNVITPLLSVITGISLEHTSYLGTDLPSIAREKSGIIKPGRPVVIGPAAEEALEVVRRTAREQQARLIQADQVVSIKQLSRNLTGQKIKIESAENSYGTLTLPLAGSYQIANTAMAVASLEELSAMLAMDLSARVVKEGLEKVRWPGRFHVVSPSPIMIVDGAHNPEAAGVLAHSLRELLPGMPLALVLGMCADKDIDRFLSPFSGLIKCCWAVPLNNKRSLPPADIAAKARALGWPVTESTVPHALDEATDWARRNQGALCVTGSLFLAGEALELKLGPDVFGE